MYKTLWVVYSRVYILIFVSIMPHQQLKHKYIAYTHMHIPAQTLPLLSQTQRSVGQSVCWPKLPQGLSVCTNKLNCTLWKQTHKHKHKHKHEHKHKHTNTRIHSYTHTTDIHFYKHTNTQSKMQNTQTQSKIVFSDFHILIHTEKTQTIITTNTHTHTHMHTHHTH